MDKKTFIALTVGGLFITTSVLAADKSWTGLKLGIGGGGQYTIAKEHVHSDFDYYADNYTESNWTDNFYGYADSVNDIGKAGGFATFDMSLDYQMDKFVVGLIANYDISKKRKANHETWGDSYYYNDDPENETSGWHGVDTQLSTGNTAALGLRLGGLITENTLLYATAGYTNIQIKQKVSAQAEVFNDYSGDYGWYEQTINKNSHKSGYFLGAGLQSKFADNLSLKLEYRMSDYGTVKNSATNNGYVEMESFGYSTSPSGDDTLIQKTDLRIHSIRAVLSYDF